MVGFLAWAIPGHVLQDTVGLDWVWPAFLGLMMLGLYYFFAVYLEDEYVIGEEFERIDTDRDGYISRDEASKLRGLAEVFDRFDNDHDGMMSRAEFDEFEHSFAH